MCVFWIWQKNARLFKTGDEKMKVIEKQLSELIPYENNPRNNDEAVRYVAESIQEFGFKVPMVVDKDGVIVAGHTRYKAAQMLGLKKVPCIVADDLSEDQVRAFRLADNKVGEIATWNDDLLMAELDGIEMDMSRFAFEELDLIDIESELDERYTTKVKIPQYEPSSIKPDVDELFVADKALELINQIKEADITESEKQFLRLAAYRHVKFNYGLIADYYAHSDTEMQKLMENSALVIIDIKDAIADGYTKLHEGITQLIDEA